MQLILSDPLFEYDIRGLLMAFYPWQKFDTEAGKEETTSLFVSYGEEAKNLHGSADASVILPCTLLLKDEELKFQESVSFEMDFHVRSQAKTTLKKQLYGLLSRAHKKTLPWGTLSGIRPTKIAMDGLNKGLSDAEIDRHMREDLLVSEGKSKLSLQIAHREKSLFENLDLENGYSLYVHIPFCPTTCLYCSFTSYPIRAYRNLVPDYLSCLFAELDYAKAAFRDKKLHTIYFGGGTPTSLEAPELDAICRKIRADFDLSDLKEWTVEAGRPDSITREKLEVLLKNGVDRISINPQTMHQKTLDYIGRFHTVEEVIEKYHLAKEVGFTNVNMDLILGLPGENFADVKETIEKVAALNPENVTIHSLAIKRAARLNTQKVLYEDAKIENTEEQMDYCRDVLNNIGLSPYYLYRQKNMAGNLENVGYAKEGKAGLYNILIMEELESIVAIGAGATTKRVQKMADGSSLITRAENVKEVKLYLSSIPEMIERKLHLFSN